MRNWIIQILLFSLGLFLLPARGWTQIPTKNVPIDGYYLGLPKLLEGEFTDAANVFTRAGQSGMRSGDARWVDSICYYSMMGECYYRLGKLPQALDNYNAAINHFLANRDWLLRTEFPATIDDKNVQNVATWGKSERSFRIGNYPTSFSTLVGRFDNDKVVQQGGVIAKPELYPVNVIEIMRCLAQAIRRRTEIMGPVCQYDPLTLQMLDALARRPGPPNHWSQCFVGLCLGLGYAAAEKDAQAVSEITASILAGGSYEHPLSAMALLELGKLAFKNGENAAAGKYFMEASYSAVLYSEYDLVEEAFIWAVTTWSASGKVGPFPPLVNAIEFARQKDITLLHTTLLVLAAEGALENNDSRSATQLLSVAKSNMLRTQIAASDTGSRYSFASAWLAFQTGRIDTGATALTAAMKWQGMGSKRLFQIGLVDVAATAGQLTDRVAEVLYAETLREPTARDWLVAPHETLTVLSIPHYLPFEHWFEICLSRKDTNKALEVGDLLRRHRFFSALPLGGRMEALRWILEASEELLSNDAKLQRQALMLKFPGYAQASQKVAELNTALEKLPADSPDRTKTLAEINRLVMQQELILHEMSVRREPSDFLFPPVMEIVEVQKKLPAGTLMFAYLATSLRVHAFALTNEKIGHWELQRPGDVKKDLQTMYTAWGLYDRNQQIAAEDLQDESWREPADRIAATLTNQMAPADWDNYKELVVVPDKLFWYVPFEALPAGTGNKEPILDKVRVRYAPTVALAVPDARSIPRSPRLAMVLGRPNPRDPEELVERASTSAVPGGLVVERWSQELPAPSFLSRHLCDRLLVMADIEDSDRAPFGWAPMVLDRGKQGSQLADWLSLPWGGPLEVAFPGFHTPVEYSLKKGGSGDEIFLSMCSLMASGSRTVILSRWRMGGASTIDLMREYHQELGHVSASHAWRRSVRLLQETELLLATEPRIRGNQRDVLAGSHPLFWSGYILCDTGNEPVEEK